MGFSVNLPSDYYLRKFYSTNRLMRLSSNRNGYSNSKLVGADAEALRRAVNNLEDIDYDSISTDELYSRVKAYADTYNNLTDSASDSINGTIVQKNNKLRSLTKEQKSDLSVIGITINSNGTLKIDSSKFKEASSKNIQKVFSKDGTFINTIKKYATQVGKFQKQYDQKNNVVSTLNIGGTTTVVSESDIVTQSLTGSNIDLQV